MVEHSLQSKTRSLAGELDDRFPALGPSTVFLQVGTGFDTAGLFDASGQSVALDELLSEEDRPASGFATHECVLEMGECEGRSLLLLKGRRHLYEGVGMDACVLPVSAAVACGIRLVIETSAVGAVQSEFKPGSVVVVTDHINNLNRSPLVGNQAMLPSPFPDMTEVYSQALCGSFVNAAGSVGLMPRMGVYQANVGPQFETPAETEAARRNGADVIGMSLVPEATMAHALGAEVLGLAIVANLCSQHGGRAISHEDVTETVGHASDDTVRALRCFFREHLE